MSKGNKNQSHRQKRAENGQPPAFAAPRWRPAAFATAHVISFLLIASWVLPPFSGWWEALDRATFEFLNGTLEGDRTMQLFWAAANHRSVDLVSGSICTLVFISWLWSQPRTVQVWRSAMLGATALPVIILPFIAHDVLEEVFHFERPSPSIVYEDALRLTQLVPELETKDASLYSFPGDHAFVLFAIIFFYGAFKARKWVVVSSVVAAIFLLPRLVAGAHWLSDNIIGGAVPALLVTAWMLATPAGAHLAVRLLPLVNLVFKLVPGWVLRSMPER